MSSKKHENKSHHSPGPLGIGEHPSFMCLFFCSWYSVHGVCCVLIGMELEQFFSPRSANLSNA